MKDLDHPVTDRATWLAARTELLAEEKDFTRARDALSARRRALPWVRIDKPYRFDTETGPATLADLFGGQRQLIVYHFMFGTDWEEGCPSCSFWADNFNGIGVHLAHRDTALIAVSKAPLAKLLAYRARMGWSFPWVSAGDSGFNEDFGVSFAGQLRTAHRHPLRTARRQRLPARRRGGLSHLFDLRPRARHAERGLPLPRPDALGPARRGPALVDGLAAPA
jgi:predicted dithiol-disulfide oxidoreductase (DUF899 family)